MQKTRTHTQYTVYYKDSLSYQTVLVTKKRIIDLQQISCAIDSCAKVQQIIHMQCRGCALYDIQ